MNIRLPSTLHRKLVRVDRLKWPNSLLQRTSVEYISPGAKKLGKRHSGQSRFPRCRLRITALVAVDYSQPAIWLGLGLIGGGLGLYQLRRVRPILSRDFDVVVSSVSIFSGGILIFQGWRLDPLLLFCQLLTAGTALAWALEAINLRRVVENDEVDPTSVVLQRFDKRSRAHFPLPDLRYRQDSYEKGLSLPPPPEAKHSSMFTDEDEFEDIEPLPEMYDSEYYHERDQSRSYSGLNDTQTIMNRSASDYSTDSEIVSGYHTEDSEDEDNSEIWTENTEQSWSSRVLDEVESFYNRPKSVVDDVEKFYEKQPEVPEVATSMEETGTEGLRSDQPLDNWQSSDRDQPYLANSAIEQQAKTTQSQGSFRRAKGAAQGD